MKYEVTICKNNGYVLHLLKKKKECSYIISHHYLGNVLIYKIFQI